MRIFRPQIGSFQGRPFPVPRPRGEKTLGKTLPTVPYLNLVAGLVKVKTTQNNKNNNKSNCLPTQSGISPHCNVVGLQVTK